MSMKEERNKLVKFLQLVAEQTRLKEKTRELVQSVELRNGLYQVGDCVLHVFIRNGRRQINITGIPVDMLSIDKDDDQGNDDAKGGDA